MMVESGGLPAAMAACSTVSESSTPPALHSLVTRMPGSTFVKFSPMVSKPLQNVSEPPGVQKLIVTCSAAAVGPAVVAAAVAPAAVGAAVVAAGPQAARAAAPAPNPAHL